jgi:hypothetical protein
VPRPNAPERLKNNGGLTPSERSAKTKSIEQQ